LELLKKISFERAHLRDIIYLFQVID